MRDYDYFHMLVIWFYESCKKAKLVKCFSGRVLLRNISSPALPHKFLHVQQLSLFIPSWLIKTPSFPFSGKL